MFTQILCMQVPTELQGVMSHLIQVLGTEPGHLQEQIALLNTESSLQFLIQIFSRLLHLRQVTIKKKKEKCKNKRKKKTHREKKSIRVEKCKKVCLKVSGQRNINNSPAV